MHNFILHRAKYFFDSQNDLRFFQYYPVNAKLPLLPLKLCAAHSLQPVNTKTQAGNNPHTQNSQHRIVPRIAKKNFKFYRKPPFNGNCESNLKKKSRLSALNTQKTSQHQISSSIHKRFQNFQHLPVNATIPCYNGNFRNTFPIFLHYMHNNSIKPNTCSIFRVLTTQCRFSPILSTLWIPKPSWKFNPDPTKSHLSAQNAQKSFATTPKYFLWIHITLQILSSASMSIVPQWEFISHDILLTL